MKTMGIVCLILSLCCLLYYVIQLFDESEAAHGWKQFPAAMLGIGISLALIGKGRDEEARKGK